MGSPDRKPGDSLKHALLEQPEEFRFHQAVRLLERLAGEQSGDGDRSVYRIGVDELPSRECVRFRGLPSLRFPASDLRRVGTPRDKSDTDRPELAVTLLGLFGSTGVLPDHYTELLIRRLKLRDRALRDFLDLFNHRIVSLYHRAWEKYHVVPQFERWMLHPGSDDASFISVLLSLVGAAGPASRHQAAVPPHVLLQYCGLFSRPVRTASDLGRVLNEHFEFPIEVREFSGRWLYLESADRSRLSGAGSGEGQYHRLGVDAMLGERLWDVQGKFRLRIGPLNYEQYASLLPGAPAAGALAELTRTFIDPALAFDVELILGAEEVPSCRLGGAGAYAPRLGLNTWLHSRPATSDVRGAVLELEAA